MKKTLQTSIIAIILAFILPIKAYAYCGPAFVATEQLNVYDGGGQNCNIIDCLPRWTNVTIDADAGYGWYKISYNGRTGYVAGYYLLFGKAEDVKPAEGRPQQITPTPMLTPTPVSTDSKIIKTAKKYIGVPYRWGGTTAKEGFDCSGFVYRVYKKNGIKLNRVAQDMCSNGVEVSLDNLQQGDILLFGSSIYNIWHVGLYAGNGTVIHASYGETVKVDNISELIGMQLITARRVL